MVGAGETYFSAFVLALGKSHVLGGLASTIPMFTGSLLQLVSPAGMRRFGSPRHWVQGCAVVQGTSLLTLAAGAWIGSMPAWLIFTSMAAYWAAALGAAPAWSTWVGHLFPARLRNRYFSFRIRLCNNVQLGFMLVAGGVLYFGEQNDWPLGAFAIILAVAAAARLSSIWYLHHQSDVRLQPSDVQQLSWRGLPSRLFRGDLRLLLFLSSLQGALFVGGPFITPWLIDSLKMNKVNFTLCLAMVFVSKSLALPVAERLVRRIGAYRLLTIGVTAAAGAAVILPCSTNLVWILAMQALCGMAFAFIELSGFLLQLETLEHDQRPALMSMYMVLNCIAVAIGSLIGAGVLMALGDWPYAYASVFVLSGVLRAAVLVIRPVRAHGRTAMVQRIEH